MGGATPPETSLQGVKRSLGVTSPPSASSDVIMCSAANHTISMLQHTEAASILNPTGHQQVLHGYQTMLNKSSVEMDRYRVLIEQLETEWKKLKEEKETQELINLKMAEEMAALKKQQPNTTALQDHIKKELVADYNNRIKSLREEDEAKRRSYITTISAEFDTKAARFRDEQTLKHQQELAQFKQDQIQY